MQALEAPELNFAFVEDRANFHMGRFGLIDEGWTFFWHNRKTQLATCFHSSKRIGFSTYWDHLERGEIEDTILHEIAHALVGPGHGHNATWKRKCVEIGADPTRCYEGPQESQATHNYELECPSCGREWKRHRLKFKNPICPDCRVELEIWTVG